jgi:adenine-specific DNA-methyltransferase
MNCSTDPLILSQYLSRNLIAYIGNKRSLLDFIREAIEYTGIQEGAFLDLFAGSGSVSRLAKTMGFSVYSNDWEFYSFVLNKAFLEIHPETLDSLFQDKGGLEKALEALNSLKTPKNPYIGKYYSPSKLDADPDQERMFYSPENGLKIDAIREKIEEWYPHWCDEKYILTALLLYESATHTNTSGVFKAYHKGFGGLGRDALRRILSPIDLEYPVLCPPAAETYRVFNQDANELVKTLSWKNVAVTYLDPPYNQHQYGSNYHILNTIALWDKPLMSNDFLKHGKAGIRRDWRKTRSAYCYQENAVNSFRELMEYVQSPFTILSYSTEGIIPFATLMEILKSHGRVTLLTNKYVKYRGGRQSLERKVNNLEFLIILERGKRHTSAQDKQIREILLEKKLEIHQNAVIDPALLEKKGWEKTEEGYRKGDTYLMMDDGIVFKDFHPEKSLKKVINALDRCQVQRKEREISLLLSADPQKYKRKILNSFKKIAHKKYREIFLRILSQLQPFFEEEKEFQKILDTAEKRGVFS